MRNILLLFCFPLLMFLFTLLVGWLSRFKRTGTWAIWRLFISLLMGSMSAGFAQTAPQSLHPGITITKLIDTQVPGVRVVMHRSSQTLYYHSWAGDIYRIEQPAGGTPYEVSVASATNHGINYLQGMAFAHNTMVLVGNYKQSGQQGYGLVVKGVLVGGAWQWTTVMQTAPYPSSTTLYDHAFSAVVVTPGGDSVYVASGSRTDHGEVEDTEGLYPNTRETALTATIFKFPLNPAQPIFLPNDSAQVAVSGYVFCRGVRNEFDMALDSRGRLFGVENSGDRDDPEEMNWLRAGRHYGFPWEMGGNQTPMQFAGYVPANDKLLPAELSQFQHDRFYNDPAYPKKPPGLVITQPIQSSGPNARYIKNPVSGQWQLTPTASTFTPHRSPLGLVFDTDSLLADFMGGAFVLAYSAGGGIRGGYMPIEDPGEDLSFVRLTYNPAIQNFTATVTKVADQFIRPTDAELVGNVLYVIEERKAIWKLTLRAALTDVSLSGQTSTLAPGLNEPVSLTLRATNEGLQHASQVVVQTRLPANLQVVSAGGLESNNGLLTSPPVGIEPGQSIAWTYQAKPIATGMYQVAAQIVGQSQPDVDSQSGSGTGDGQDDALLLTFRTREAGSDVFASPNPNQTPLPVVVSSQPVPPANQADLSLAIAVDKRAPGLQEVVTYTLTISNRGMETATGVNVQVTYPAGLAWVSSDVNAAGTLPIAIGAVAAGSSVRVTFQLRTLSSGQQICQAQINSSSLPDPDSTPGNGYATGEDDTAICDIRVR